MLLYESKTNPETRFEFNVSSLYTDKNVLLAHFINGIVEHDSMLNCANPLLTHLIGLNDRAEI